MKIHDLTRLLKDAGISPNKKLGQNFLIDETVIEKIIHHVDPGPVDSILEIGPGLGALTAPLAKSSGRLTALEIDSGLARYLAEIYRESGTVRVIHGDFLKADAGIGYTKIVSNLPYYCSSEILFRAAVNNMAQEIFVTVQKEMAERIVARPGSKSYGAISVTLGFYCERKILFQIGKNSFYPRPEVNSCFMHLKRRKVLALGDEGTALFHDIVKSAFWGRRKTLQKSLSESPHLGVSREDIIEALNGAGVDGRVRGEELSPDDFVRIVQSWHRLIKH